MAAIKLSGVLFGFNFEYTESVDTPEEAHAIAQALKRHGEFLPPARFEKKADFEPFVGVIENIEPTKTNNGKDMFIANVRPRVKEGEEAKPLFAVKYMPPKSTWRVNDVVRVTKNDKGWAELKEEEVSDDVPF